MDNLCCSLRDVFFVFSVFLLYLKLSISRSPSVPVAMVSILDSWELELLHVMAFLSTDTDKAIQHSSPFSFPWPLGSQFSMMGLSELKAAISLENDSVASSEKQRIMKWTVDDVMSHVRSLGCTEQAKIFGDQVS